VISDQTQTMQGGAVQAPDLDSVLNEYENKYNLNQPKPTEPKTELNIDSVLDEYENKYKTQQIKTYSSDAFTPESMRFFSGIKGIDNLFTPEQKKAFDDLDNVLPSDESRESVRARVISQKFAETQLPGLPPSYLAENWDAVKSGFMQKFNESKKNVTDDEFYNFLGTLHEQVNYVKNYDAKTSEPPKPWTFPQNAAQFEELTKKAGLVFWDSINTKAFELPDEEKVEEALLPDKNIVLDSSVLGEGVGEIVVNPAVFRGVYDAIKPFYKGTKSFAEGTFLTPAFPLTVLAAGAAGALLAPEVAAAAVTMGSIYFAYMMASSASDKISKFYNDLHNPDKTTADKITSGTEAFWETAGSTAIGLHTVSTVLPKEISTSILNKAKTDPKGAGQDLIVEANNTDVPGAKDQLTKTGNDLIKAGNLMPENRQTAGQVEVGEKPPTSGQPVSQADMQREMQQRIDSGEAARAGSANGPQVQSPLEQSKSADVPVVDPYKPNQPRAINNENMDKMSDRWGVERLTPAEKTTFNKEINDVRQKIEQDPTYLRSTVDRLLKDPNKTPTVEDELALGFEGERLENERLSAEQRLLNARKVGDVQAEQIAQNDIDKLRDDYAKIYDLDKKLGTASGRSLVFRKAGLREDFSLPALERKLTAAKGSELTPEELENTRKLATQIDEAQKQVDIKNAESRARASAPKDVPKKSRPSKQIADYLSQKAIESRKELKSILGGARASEGLSAAGDIGYHLSVVGADYIAKGTTKFTEWSKKMTDEFGEKIVPNLKEIYNKAIVYIEHAKDDRALEERKAKIQAQIVSLTEKIEKGEFEPKPKTSDRPEVKEIEELLQEREKLAKQLAEARKGKKLPVLQDEVKKKLDSLNKLIEKRREILDSREPAPPKKQELPYNEQIEKAKQELKYLNKQINEFRYGVPEEAPKLTPEELRDKKLAKRFTSLADRLKEKMQRGDLEPVPKKELYLGKESSLAYAKLNALKQEFRSRAYELERKRRSVGQKVADTAVEVRKSLILSSPAIAIKLIALSFENSIGASIDRFVGYELGLAHRAFEGTPLNSRFESAPSFGGYLRGEAKAYAAMWNEGLPGFLKIVREEPANLEKMFEKNNIPHSIIDKLLAYPQHLHKALHYPLQVSDYAARLVYLTEKDLRDFGPNYVKEPVNQFKNMQQAWEYSKRSIYMQDDKFVNDFNQLTTRWSKSDTDNYLYDYFRKTSAFTGKIAIPIDKVPVNVAKGLAVRIGGILELPIRTVFTAVGRGEGPFEGLNSDQVDSIVRHFSKGSVGAALVLTGFYNWDRVGGLRQKGEYRDERELQFGQMKMGDTRIPAQFLEAEAIKAVQAGATMGRAFNSLYYKKGISMPESAMMSMLAMSAGVADTIPYVNAMGGIGALTDPRYEDKAFVRSMSSLFTAGLPDDIAKAMDRKDWWKYWEQPTYRGTKTEGLVQPFVEELKLGTPGLRSTVPRKIEKSYRKSK